MRKAKNAIFVLKCADGRREEFPVAVDLKAKKIEAAEIALENARAAFNKNKYDRAAHKMIEDAAVKYLAVFFGDECTEKMREISNIPAVYLAARPFISKYVLPEIRKESRARYKALRRAARK